MNKKRTDVVIPVKRLAGAKSRIADVLGEDERRELVLAMLEDVVAAATHAARLAAGRSHRVDVSVLSPDPDVLAFANRIGSRGLVERPGVASLNEALAATLAELGGRVDSAALVLHADTPLGTADELATLMACDGEPVMVIVPDRVGRGTNALLLRPPIVVPPRFGSDSLAQHLGAARAHELAVRVCPLDGVGLDVDTPDDLAAVLRSDADGRTRRFLAGLDLAGRLSLARERASDRRSRSSFRGGDSDRRMIDVKRATARKRVDER
ncbi:MAG: 2-phospho-L-lactate guanylyltransferase [Chloroflexi bacterium]|nr:2-phospho-L-lactate guanylyltransferase [Chloroflexota bacterium]